MSPALQSESTGDQCVDERLALQRLLEVSSVVLGQGIDLVNNSLTSNDQLVAQSKYIPGSTIGKHLRHARDHFALLLDCVSSDTTKPLNYDLRSRNTPMENDRLAADQAFKQTIAQLEAIVPRTSLDKPLTLNAVTPYPQTMETTFGRELWFAALHAVHHWSMVRVIAGELGIELEESFGFAPSTLVYQGSEAPLGRPKI
ncbi:hypothetical protein C8Q75DRAFT_773944 [Abortiporus biennis]|nr:hypothetical protein C8Q75DRAFT_773944 [Abortiporus biennis]